MGLVHGYCVYILSMEKCISIWRSLLALSCNVGSHGKLAHALASHLRPAALTVFDEAMAAVFVAGAEVRHPVLLPVASTHDLSISLQVSS